ncbi:hypothetical protein [Corynebacterium bouchesdurhonense]|uniref:hypothetical protein n=1 Tax=Corynebacterium bouchesdurhonense TaxID=1720192 RepID=UPI0011773B6B|nr:hypothetical protein [Corynebacterium bouchesdurhonense]
MPATRTWTMRDWMLWSIYGELIRANGYYRAELGIKPNRDRFKWPASPFEAPEDDKTRLGNVASEDQAAAVDYLLALSPPPAT